MSIQPLTKGMPTVLRRKFKRAAIEKDRVAIKDAVFRRDGGRCRVCGAPATEMHELVFRSRGGKRSLYNSIAVCDWRANSCHQMLQKHVITHRFWSESFGADSTITFTMGPRRWESRPSVTVGGGE